MLSAQDLAALRAIARAGSDYAQIKRELAVPGWEIEEDEPDLGYLRLAINDGFDDETYRLIIAYRDPEHPPQSLLTFQLFPDSEEQIPEFNTAFQAVAEVLKNLLGPPALSGEHQLSFRSWPYAYHRWSLSEGEFTLLQGEFDIQDGLDITLWIQPVGTPIAETLDR